MTAVQVVEAPHAPDPHVAEIRALVRRGRVTAALALTAPLLADAEALHRLAPADHALLLAIEVECRMARGDLDAAIGAADALEPFTHLGGLTASIAFYSRADLAAALGEVDLALERFLASGAADASGFAPWRMGATNALVRLSRRREALGLAREYASAMVGRSTYDVANALRTLAVADPEGRGVPRFREAQALLTHSDAERLRAQIDADLACQLILSGDAADLAEAVVLLRSAEDYAGREDLWPLQTRVRRLLERVGETPRRMEAEALAMLTAAERRVTLLVLDGLTNRQIAVELMVSVKAIEGHLSKVYRKLGVASRAALTAALRSGRPLDEDQPAK